jgi:tRNA nucleotidyltransferase/poly(A) polymerase
MENRIKHHIELPEDILKIKDIFKKNGHELYVVGGAVRDAINGIEPKDYDLATDAHPDKVESMLTGIYRMLPIGKAFGIWQANTPTGEFEIATFREDIGSGRRPDDVKFTTIEEDVKRRDLTINALFYDTDTEEIVDFVGGIEDLKNGIIRAVGDPTERFNEDRLRILRAIRFAGITGSELDEKMDASLKNDSSLGGISGERIREEFTKGIIKSASTKYFLNLIDKYNLFDWIFPEMIINKNYIENNNPILVISTLLLENDLSKISNILNRASYSNSDIENIKFLVSLPLLDEDSIYEMKKSHSKTTLSDEEILEFANINNLNTKLINSFLKYQTSVTGRDVMNIYNIEQGPDVGKYIKRLELEKFKDMYNSNESYKFKHIVPFKKYNIM